MNRTRDFKIIFILALLCMAMPVFAKGELISSSVLDDSAIFSIINNKFVYEYGHQTMNFTLGYKVSTIENNLTSVQMKMLSRKMDINKYKFGFNYTFNVDYAGTVYMYIWVVSSENIREFDKYLITDSFNLNIDDLMDKTWDFRIINVSEKVKKLELSFIGIHKGDNITIDPQISAGSTSFAKPQVQFFNGRPLISMFRSDNKYNANISEFVDGVWSAPSSITGYSASENAQHEGIAYTGNCSGISLLYNNNWGNGWLYNWTSNTTIVGAKDIGASQLGSGGICFLNSMWFFYATGTSVKSVNGSSTSSVDIKTAGTTPTGDNPWISSAFVFGNKLVYVYNNYSGTSWDIHSMAIDSSGVWGSHTRVTNAFGGVNAVTIKFVSGATLGVNNETLVGFVHMQNTTSGVNEMYMMNTTDAAEWTAPVNFINASTHLTTKTSHSIRYSSALHNNDGSISLYYIAVNTTNEQLWKVNYSGGIDVSKAVLLWEQNGTGFTTCDNTDTNLLLMSTSDRSVMRYNSTHALITWAIKNATEYAIWSMFDETPLPSGSTINPTITGISVIPVLPYANSTFNCSATSVTSNYSTTLNVTLRWLKNTVYVSNTTLLNVANNSYVSAVFTSTNLSHWDNVSCNIQASDALGTSSSTSTVTVQNTFPLTSIPTITVSGFNISCRNGTSYDFDNDTLYAYYRYYKNGANVSTFILNGTKLFTEMGNYSCEAYMNDGWNNSAYYNSTNYLIENLSLYDQSLILNGSYTFNKVNITKTNISVLTDLTIYATIFIFSNDSRFNLTGTICAGGTGIGADGAGENDGGGGGSYGGSGTAGADGGGAAGSVYGTATGTDIAFGSSGGYGNAGGGAAGGCGGGMLKVSANTIYAYGLINATGTAGKTLTNNGGGGGSGGGIMLNASYMYIDGLKARVDGGLQGIADNPINYGGSGGGGRIKIIYKFLTNVSTDLRALAGGVADNGTVAYISSLSYTFRFFDEATGNSMSNVNLSVFNSTYSYSLENINNTAIPYNSMPTGDVIAVATYNSRNKYRYFTVSIDDSSKNIDFYFSTTSYLFTFFANYNGIGINDVLINVTRIVNGTWMMVGQGRTEATGYAGIYVTPDTYHTYTAEASGYTTIVNNSNFLSSMISIQINLNFGASNSSYSFPDTNTWFPTNIKVTWQPANTTILLVPTMVNASVSDSSNNIIQIRLNVTKWLNTTGKTYYYESYTGANKKFNVSVSSKGNYKFYICFDYKNATYCGFRWFYYAGSSTGIGNWTVQDIDDAGGLSVMAFKVFFFLIVCFLFAVLFPVIGIGTIIIGIIAFIFGAMVGILTAGEAVLLVILCIIIISIGARSGG